MSHAEPLLSNVPDLQNDNATTATNTESPSRFAFLKKVREFREEKLARLRPLNDFFDKSRFSFTGSISEVTKRWNYNLQHFAVNYMLIVLGLAIYAVITNWSLLFTIAFIFGGFFVISRLDGPLTIGNTSISASAMYGAYCGASLILLLFSGATGAIFWIISAAAVVILAHAALLEPSIESEFNADNQV
ncbi:PRA1-domain-containing protein [Lichtheimia hyalospora FSU 10163]|nr:PRA1-domain-containing protein [Lichtheimia hyalospora FSU 10163]